MFNADENAHFVPRAIGMFGHSLNPDYFINPPAYTYLLHFAYWLWWGSREALGDAFATDPATAFTIARVLSAVLGAAAVGFLAWAGRRLFDWRVGLLAGALLAVAFLPVHYAHLAVNDVPALAPLCLSLVGIAGVYRRGHLVDYALAGAALGVACATKYTAGIVVLCLVAAAATSRAGAGRLLGLALAAVLAIAGFVVANPYAVLDWDAFRAGLEQQSQASSDGGGKLGLVGESGLLYYLGTLTWGLGWLPALAAAAGAVLALDARPPARARAGAGAGRVPGLHGRAGPLLRSLAAADLPDPVPAGGVGRGAGRRARARRRACGRWSSRRVLLCAQGLVFSVHNDVVLARDDTRALARDWMVENIPEGDRVVIEPIAPDQWAMDVGRPSAATGTGNRWIKWPTSRFRARAVKLEDFERTLRTEPARPLRARRLLLRRDRLDPVRPRADRAGGGPAGDPLLRRAAAARRRRLPRQPARATSPCGGFSFDFSFNSYPLGYERPGPEVVIYRLRDCP